MIAAKAIIFRRRGRRPPFEWAAGTILARDHAARAAGSGPVP